MNIKGRPQPAAHMLIHSRCPCLYLFSLCCFFHHPSWLFCQLPIQHKSPPQTDVRHGHISLLFTVLCRLWSVTRFLTPAGPFCKALNLPLIPAHNSFCRHVGQPGATERLSHSCSGFDLLPFTFDLSHCGRLPIRGEIPTRDHSPDPVRLNIQPSQGGLSLARLLCAAEAMGDKVAKSSKP